MVKTEIIRDENYSKNYFKKWYEVNKEKHKKQLTDEIICSNCNSKITKVNILRHMNTKKCKSFENKESRNILEIKLEEMTKEIAKLQEQNQLIKNKILECFTN